jgi:hypothetical protein
MVEVRERKETIITPATDGGAGAAAMVILALIFVAVIGYMIYAFSGNNSRTVIERDTNTTIQQPVAAPSAPSPVPANSDNGSSQPSADSSAPGSTNQ